MLRGGLSPVPMTAVLQQKGMKLGSGLKGHQGQGTAPQDSWCVSKSHLEHPVCGKQLKKKKKIRQLLLQADFSSRLLETLGEKNEVVSLGVFSF